MFRKCCQSVLLVLAASWVLLGWGVTVCAIRFGEWLRGWMMPNGELGYVFKSAVTANGCLMLCITPHARRRDFHSKVYVFTADEVRALIEALAVMPDGPE